MSFLNPIALFGLFAITLPIIIHLLNRRRHRVVQWAAMQFLLKASRESRGRKRLKHIIILACRALAVGMLIFALARPLVGSLLGWGGGRVDTVILLLDRSASMESRIDSIGPSKREAVIERVAKALKELGGARLVLIDSVSYKAQDVPSPEVLPQISAAGPSDSSANIPAMLTSAVEFISEANTGRTEIWLASDLRKHDWAPEDGRWDSLQVTLNELPEQTSLRILGLGSEILNNRNIRVNSARRSGDELILNMVASRIDEKGDLTIPITYSLDGARSTDTLTITDQTLQYQKRFSILGRKDGGHGWISIPADNNASDNVSYFAYGPDKPAQSYIISDDSEAGTYLQIATAPPGYGNEASALLAPNKTLDINFNEAALIIWQAPLPQPEEPITQSLTAFLEKGGRIIFFPPTLPSLAETEAPRSFLDMSWGELEIAAKDAVFSIGEWERDEGPLRDGISNAEVPVKRLKAIKRMGISGTATTLAFWQGSKPAISRKIIGRGAAIFVSTIPNYKWSNLGDGEVLLPIVQRSLEEASLQLGSRNSIEAGSSEAQILPGEFRSRIDDYNPDSAISAPDQAGVYQNDSGSFAINRPVEEDSPEIITREEIDLLLENTPYGFFGEQTATQESFVSEIWRPFLIAMLFFLITEALLSLNPNRNKNADGVSTKRSLTKKTA